MKTAGKENPNRCAITRQPTELLGRKLELSLLNQVGWKARKHPATAKYFFLTFPFIDLTRLSDGQPANSRSIRLHRVEPETFRFLCHASRYAFFLPQSENRDS